MLGREEISAALDAILQYAASGDSFLSRYASQNARTPQETEWSDDEYAKVSAEWNLELAYTTLLVLTETLGLMHLREEVAVQFAEARSSLHAIELDPEGEVYARWSGPIRLFARAIQDVRAIEASQTVTKEITAILRNATYAIWSDPISLDRSGLGLVRRRGAG